MNRVTGFCPEYRVSVRGMPVNFIPLVKWFAGLPFSSLFSYSVFLVLAKSIYIYNLQHRPMKSGANGEDADDGSHF
ncbi:MAG: hypothetical protein LUQ31_06530 [Methanoregula sp.]|nr:hypothetical protein [Methanoregula sp.]